MGFDFLPKRKRNIARYQYMERCNASVLMLSSNGAFFNFCTNLFFLKCNYESTINSNVKGGERSILILNAIFHRKFYRKALLTVRGSVTVDCPSGCRRCVVAVGRVSLHRGRRVEVALPMEVRRGSRGQIVGSAGRETPVSRRGLVVRRNLHWQRREKLTSCNPVFLR